MKGNMKKLAVLMVAVAMGAFIPLGGGPALASHVSCGATLTVDTTLDSDLTCTGTALIIGADGITLDLKDHTLKGNGTGIGVDNTGGKDNVTIKQGVIDHFAYGVFLMNASHNTLTHLTVQNNVNTTGVEGTGILLWLANDSNTISKNKIKDNARQGMYLGCNPFAFPPSIPGPPPVWTGAECNGKHADNNLIEKNEITDNGKAGFDAYGIQLHFADGNTVSKNDISGHAAWYFGQGIYVLSSSGNLIEKNELEENRFGSALWDGGFVGTANGNVFSKNELNENGDVGLRIFSGTAGTIVEKNEANKNGFALGNTFNLRDGIRASGAGVTLTKNKADDNADLGIEATGGVVDGGGNKAEDNGNLLQCTGVAC